MDRRLQRHEYGFLELVKPPNEDELTKYYADKYYQSEQGNYRNRYSPEEHAVINLRIKLRATQADHLRGTNDPGRLLDVGCGEGFVLSAYEANGWDVEGIDHSIEGVRGMNPDQLKNVRQGNLFRLLEDCVAAGSAYDIVWLGNVLEHVRNPVDLMRSIRAIVKPSGLLVATVPNDGTPYHEELFDSGAIPDRFWIAIPDHLSYFTRESLARTAEATGWMVRKMQGDFPIDLFLSHPGSNYVADRAQGGSAHSARLTLEAMIGRAGTDAANEFYTALAGVGLGRNLTAYLAPNKENTL
ncbi:class I SAM-dependent methyltransferase [Denitrobaculum tricleocarpae]|nr:class I SAM-dependent methyltransferase [Denitrobaculum tricleocarpae]